MVKMDVTYILYFGGQEQRSASILRQLQAKAAGSSPLKTFLNRSLDLVRFEIKTLQPEVPSLADISTLEHLVDGCADEGPHDVVLSTVALYVAQMGDYVLRIDEEPSLLVRPKRLVGICTGTLPAIVAAASQTMTELLEHALSMLSVAIRLAVQAKRRSEGIEKGADPWSMALSGAIPSDLQVRLNEYNKSQALPDYRQLYISAESPTSKTLSGPPSILQAWASGLDYLGLRTANLPIYSAFHAPHLPAPDIAGIMSPEMFANKHISSGSTVVSSGSQRRYTGDTVRDILKEAILDILQHRLFHYGAFSCALQGLESPEKVVLMLLGPANAKASLQTSLEMHGLTDFDIRIWDPSPEGPMDNRFAIVGMAGRFPRSESPEDLWDIIHSAKTTHTQVPKTRFDIALHGDPSGNRPNSTTSTHGCFLERPGVFDHRLFNMSPREALQMDPQHRLLLMATYEALESAGYSYPTTGNTRERVGSFIAMTANDYVEYNTSQEIDIYAATGGLRAFSAGRLNYYFKWDGPAITVDTACSSGLVAVYLACQALQSGECEMAVVGGVNLITGPSMYAALSRAGFTSPTGACKTFDASADGYCRGEAIGVLVLRRLRDATARGHGIQGVIRGAATNHSAHAVSITQPHSPAQQDLYQVVLRKAGLATDDIGYIEAHGTGTQAGDSKEMDSIYKTFAPGRKADNPLYVGGVKANVGHGEAAAGITSIIKALMMFRKDTIPPHPLPTRLNPVFPPLEQANIHVARAPVPFLSSKGTRRILVNSFGASGNNTAVLLEEAPVKTAEIGETDPRPSHIIAVSAKTVSSFEENKKRLIHHIRCHPAMHIRHLAYTTTARRMHLPIKKAFCASSLEELEMGLARDTAQRDHPSSPPTVVFMFPGQGLVFQGFAKQLYDTCNPFKNDLLELDRLVQTFGLPSFLQTLLEAPGDESTGRTEVELQLALVALEMALSRLLMSWGIKPDLVIGHSLGEYGALHVAGVLSAADTMFLVGNRARLIERLCAKHTHGMLSVGAPSVAVRRILDQDSSSTRCELTCFNTPHTTVVGGPLEALQAVEQLFSEQHGLRCTMLRPAYAYHSAQIDPILEPYTQLAKGVRFSAPTVAVASTVEGSVVGKGTRGLFSAQYLADHARKAVRFEQALGACETEDLVGTNTLLIEVGPGAMCLSMARSTLRQPGHPLPCLKTGQDTWEALSAIAAQAYTKGLPISWAEYHRPYASDLAFIDLPTYSFELKDFWLQYRGGTAAMEEEVKRLEQRVLEASQAPPAAHACEEEMLTSSIHRIDRIDLSGDCGSVSFVSDIGRAPLRNLIEGHDVVGVLLTPACVYAEMATMAARQFFELVCPGKQPPSMEINNASIFAPLALRSDGGVQLVTITVARATADKAVLSVTIASDQNHARCDVFLLDDGGKSRSSDWSRRHYLVHDRAMALVAQSHAHDDVHRVLRGMVYRIFSSVTRYSADYHSIAAIYIKANFCEAAVQLDTRETPPGCSFTHDPTWQDGIAQAAGFMVNSSLTRPEDMLYVMTGWEKMALTGSLGPSKRYLCHVRADTAPGLEATVKCDVTVMDGSTIVAMGEGLTFKRIKMASLQSLVTSPSRSATAKSEPTRAVISSPAKNQPPVLGTKGRKAKAVREPHKEDTRLAKVLRLIADETGASMAELADDATLGDLGVDSLLSVAVASKLATDLGIELPAVLLLSTVTIAEIRAHFDGTSHEHGSGDSTTSESSSESMAALSTLSTPSSISDPPSPSLAPSAALLGEALVTAVAAEAGMERADLDEDTAFQDVGLDSLMSIAVLGAVKDRTGVELPASLLNDTKDIREARSRIEAMFGYGREERAGTALTDPIPFSAVSTRIEVGASTASSSGAQWIDEPRSIGPNTREPDNLTTRLPLHSYRSKAVLLQGRPEPDAPKLFLVSEGSGSAAAYINLPELDGRTSVYGLESPFLRCPEQFFCSMEDVCGLYVDAIRAVQPRGPYLLGGWSIGGMYAYEAARQLTAAGEAVHGLLLVESACPRRLAGLPAITLAVCEETGMFAGMGGRALSRAEKLHVVGCVRAVAAYEPAPLAAAARPPHAAVVWSRFGLFEKLSLRVREAGERMLDDDDDGGAAAKTGITHDWLTAERTNFGPQGWDRLLGPQIACHQVDGDHFTIMMLPKVKSLTGPLLQQLVASMVDTLPLNSRSMLSPFVSSHTVSRMFLASSDLRRVIDHDERCDDFWSKVFPEQSRLVLSYVVEAFAELDCDLATIPEGSLVAPVGVLPKHAMVQRILFQVLETEGLVEPNGGEGYRRTSKPLVAVPSSAVLSSLVRDFPQWAVTHQLHNVTGSALSQCLTGEKNAMQLVFGLHKELIGDFYTKAPFFAAASRQLTDFLRAVLADWASGPGRPAEPLELLEVGAGLGGTTVYVLDMLAELGVPFRYTYTDISPSLVAAARRRWAHLGAAVEFAVLDITRADVPAARRGRFHVVLASNCVHATPSLRAAAANVRQMLRPGGVMALIELTTRLALLDLLFGFFDSWWLFRDGRQHALADVDFWRKSLAEAGFGTTEGLLEKPRSGDGPVNPQLIVAINDKI